MNSRDGESKTQNNQVSELNIVTEDSKIIFLVKVFVLAAWLRKDCGKSWDRFHMVHPVPMLICQIFL